MKLNEIFSIDKRLTRSINIAEDLFDSIPKDSYVWTKSSSALLTRILQEQEDGGHSSAFSLTGPFGTGKSAFVLNFLRLFSKDRRLSTSARNSLAETADESTETLKTISLLSDALPIVITGEQSSIKEVMAKGILNSIARQNIKAPSLRYISKLIKNGKTSELDVSKCLKDLARIARDNDFKTIILVIDEFGKLLEYAALHPKKSDIYALQQIAETRRAELSANFIFLNVLHQSFAGYARHLSQQSQNEWIKIQGRFCNLNMSERPEELSPLILASIATRDTYGAGKINIDKKSKRRDQFEEHHSLQFMVPLLGRRDTKNLSVNSYPFNPLSIFTLPFLSKMAGQNNRSTFTFLSSNEPNSFGYFLDHTDSDESSEITLDYLFDYFKHSAAQFGDNISHRRWTEVEVAVERLNNPESTEAKVLKTIGVLNILQNPRVFPAREDLIQLAFEGTATTKEDVRNAIKILIDKKIMVFRNFSQEYRIWEGSDFSIEEALAKRKETPVSSEDIIKHIEKIFPVKKIIARRHYEETGTLRVFAVRFLTLPQLQSLDESNTVNKTYKSTAEGNLCIVATFTDDEFIQGKEIAARISKTLPSFSFHVTEPEPNIYNVVQEHIALEDIRASESILANDPVAKKEVDDRLFESEHELRSLVDDTYWLFDKEFSLFWNGQEEKLESQRALQKKLSSIFSAIFRKAPKNYNELLNRYFISGSVSSACNNIIEGIISARDKKCLGFEGFSAHATVYRLLYKQSGMHHEQLNGKYCFGKPTNTTWLPFWEELNAYVATNNNKDIPLIDIIDTFTKPPFGIRPPVIQMALIAYLFTEGNGIQLFEEDSYVPEIRAVTLELIMKRPKLFYIRYSGQMEKTKPVIKALQETFAFDSAKSSDSSLLSIIRDLYRIIRGLKQYSMQTREISPGAIAVRNEILRANKPEELLFSLLPEALSISRDSVFSNPKHFAVQLKIAIDDLTNSYDKLIQSSRKILEEQFDIGRSELRKSITKRAMSVSAIAEDLELKNFCLKATDATLKEELWIEKLIGSVALKPVESWSDADKKGFRMKCKSIHYKFKLCEILLTEKPKGSCDELFAGKSYYISGEKGEIFTDVNITVPNDPKIKEASDSINSLFSKYKPHKEAFISAILEWLSKKHE